MHIGPARDIVITKFSLIAFCLHLIAVMAMLVGFWSLALNPSGITDKAIFENRIWWIVALLFTSGFSWVEWVILQQMIFHGRRAVWIEDGHLKIIDYQGIRERSLTIADIRELSIGSIMLGGLLFWWPVPCVTLKMKDGFRSHSIMTLYLADSAQVVCARLSEAVFGKRSPQCETVAEAH